MKRRDLLKSLAGCVSLAIVPSVVLAKEEKCIKIISKESSSVDLSFAKQYRDEFIRGFESMNKSKLRKQIAI